MGFKKATKAQAKLRMAIHGPSGSGKTRSALEIARHIGTKIALLDTEQGSASKFAHLVEFDVEEIYGNYHPNRAIKGMDEAAAGGYDVLIIDSLSHFWNGVGGFLELVDEEVKKMRARGGKADSFAAWKEIDPIYRRLIQAILSCPMHVIVTMRAKQEYIKEQDDRGKTTIRKVGMAPEMRDAAQYEFDVEGMLDIDHNLVIGKTRCDELDGKVFNKPGRDVAEILKRWLSDGVPAVQRPAAPTQDERPAPPARREPEQRQASRRSDVAAPEAPRDASESSRPPQGEPRVAATVEADGALCDDLITGIIETGAVERVRENMQRAERLSSELRERVLVHGIKRLLDLVGDDEVAAVDTEARTLVGNNLVRPAVANKEILPAMKARKAQQPAAA
ncbi:AAA family ATPase [Sorangium sp. So ce118]